VTGAADAAPTTMRGTAGTATTTKAPVARRETPGRRRRLREGGQLEALAPSADRTLGCYPSTSSSSFSTPVVVVVRLRFLKNRGVRS
jgi:hypothetical protein